VSAPAASVIVRARDEAASIGRVLELLHAQELAGGARAEVIVVDSGSTDGTGAIARGMGATVIEIPAAGFTFGGSLNTGCEASSAPILVALSAHAFPRDTRWLARMLDCFGDPLVACAYGCPNAPEGGELRGRLVQDEQHARRYPYWGYGNPAGGFRAELWRRRPFRADMPGTEDKEWAWHWLQRGMRVVIDPELAVGHDHSKDGAPDIYRRYRREWQGYGMYLDLPPYPLQDVVREWWFERDTYRSHMRARLSHRRAARLAGTWAGRRSARR
jgi:glycosyltransferase involved in cell wall biosynthesis